MKIIVGLGNPGLDYEKTRHNVGFMALDALAAEFGVSFTASKKTFSHIATIGNDLLLCKPQTFMNRSGQAVRALLEYYKFSLPTDSENGSNFFVVHDDLDLALGTTKLQLGVGPKSHNGLLSVYEHLGTNNFWHARVGVDNRGELRNTIIPSEYVLQPFMQEEMAVVEKAVHKICAELQAK